MKTYLSRHDTVAARVRHAPLDVLVIQDVAVRKYRHFDSLLDSLDLVPVGEPCMVALHFPGPAVASEDLGPGAFKHLRVRNRLLRRVENAELGRHGNREVFVENAD